MLCEVHCTHLLDLCTISHYIERLYLLDLLVDHSGGVSLYADNEDMARVAMTRWRDVPRYLEHRNTNGLPARLKDHSFQTANTLDAHTSTVDHSRASPETVALIPMQSAQIENRHQILRSVIRIYIDCRGICFIVACVGSKVCARMVSAFVLTNCGGQFVSR